MEPVSDVRDFLENLGYKVQTNGKHLTLVESWEQWYRGKVDKFHNYQVYNGVKKVDMEKKSLGLAKKSCEDWADLILNEKVNINVEPSIQETLNEILKENSFQTKANKLIEKAFALGYGAFVEYKDNSRKNGVHILFLSAKKIFPLRFVDDEIVDVAFASEIGDRKYYVNIHTRNDETGIYTIENIVFDANNKNDISVSSIPGVLPKFTSEVPQFQFIWPSGVNNDEIDSPMHLSVFANAIDEMKDSDEKFDSYFNEFKLGKKRIFVDPSLLNVAVSKDGNPKQSEAFDSDDIAFYGLNLNGSSKKIEQTDFNLRVSEHSQALQDALNLFADTVGFGPNHYVFKDGKVYTNTANIISSNSKMFRRLKKHELIIDESIKNMVKACLYIKNGTEYTGEINIDFDDSIIEDKESEKRQYMSEVAAGLMSGVEYRMKVYGEDEQTAKKMIPEPANVME